jgi:hypothetical protein
MSQLKALQKVRKTHFGTHWIAANALNPCLPNVKNLVIAKTIKFKVIHFIHLHPKYSHPCNKNTKVQGMFMNRASEKYGEFERGLLQYIAIVAPII